jgi:hypothetical protein
MSSKFLLVLPPMPTSVVTPAPQNKYLCACRSPVSMKVHSLTKKYYRWIGCAFAGFARFGCAWIGRELEGPCGWCCFCDLQGLQGLEGLPEGGGARENRV